MCEERWNKLPNESNGVTPLAAFRDAVNLDVLHFVSILFSSSCSSQQFLLRIHCTSLQGAFLLDWSALSLNPHNLVIFFLLKCLQFGSKYQEHMLEKSRYLLSRKLSLLFDPSMFCSLLVLFIIILSHDSNKPAYNKKTSHRITI